MIRFCTILLCLLSVCVSSRAQIASTKERYAEGVMKIKYFGQIVDSTELTPLPRAVIHLVSKLQTGLTSQWIIADTSGKFNFEVYNFCPSRIEISMLGYKLKTIHLDKSEPFCNLGKIKLSVDDINIDEATVRARQRISLLKGDTLRIVAPVAKTMKGDALIEILRQVPELTVNSDGSVSYKGDVISLVTINDKKIFGDDNIAPYYLLNAKDASYIDVFEEDDELAQRETLDKGRKRKRMNIFTVEDFDHYTAGNLVAESGVNGKNSEQRDLNDRYVLGGGIGLYSEPRQIVVESAVSNISQNSAFYSPQNTLLIVGSNPADKKYANLAYNIESKKKDKYKVNFKWNDTKVNNSNTSELSYFKNDDFDSQIQRNVTSNTSDGHSLNGGFSMSLISNPNTIFDVNSNIYYTKTEQVINKFGQMTRDNIVISSSNSEATTERSHYRIPLNFKLSHKFNGYNLLSLKGDIQYSNKTQTSLQDVNDANDSNLNTITLVDLDNKNPSMTTNSSLQFRHNFKKYNNKAIDFTLGHSYTNDDQRQIAYDRVTGEINELYSIDQKNIQQKLTFGIGSNLGKNLRVNISFNHDNLKNEESNNDVNANFNTIGFSLNGKLCGFNASLSKNTSLPLAHWLSNKLNVTNPYYLMVGNANLKPAKHYNLNLSRHLKILNLPMDFSVNARYIDDWITYHRTYYAESTVLPQYDNYVVNSGASLVTPFNGPSRFEISGRFGINHNAPDVGTFRNSFEYRFDRDYEEYNSKSEHKNNHFISHMFEFTSNFSYTFRVSLKNKLNYIYTRSANDSSEAGLSNETSFYAVGDLFDRLRVEVAYLMNFYNTPFINRESHTLNARVGIRVFKNRMGVLSLNAMDILGNNDQWKTMQTTLGIISQMAKCLTNYYSVSFAYKFNNKK